MKGALAAGALVALTLAACGSGGSASAPSGTHSMDMHGGPSPRPSSPAKIQILTPTNGQVVKGPDVPLRIKLTGGKIVQPSTTHVVPTEGHVHVALDGQLVSMNFGLNQPLKNVSPGTHTLHVEFVASDHQPFDPRVFQEIAFTVKK